MNPITTHLAAAFLAPALAVAGAAAVSIPIAIHLLSRMRRKPVRWGAMRFLQLAMKQQRNRLRLESFLLLLVRCLLVLIAGLALASPVLTGCAARLTGGLDPSGRTVHLVIDNALSTQAAETADRTRFDRHRAAALAMLDALSPRDAVAVWSGARPAEAVVDPPTTDHAAVRAAIEAMTPRHSVSDVPAALQGADEQLERAGVPDGRGVVAVLGDFPVSAEYLSTAPPGALSGLGDAVDLVVSRPSGVVGNVQVSALRPRRAMVLTQGPASATVAVSVTLRRLGAGSAAARTPIKLTLHDADGTERTSMLRTLSWAPGQVEASLNAELLLDDGFTPPEAGAAAALVRVEIQSAASDALAADNTAWATVTIKPGFTVGVIDDPTPGASADAFEPGRLLAAALSPGGQETESVVTLAIEPGAVSTEALADCDALFVLRPDLLPSSSWDTLARYAEAGGLVWITAPLTDGSAVWPESLRRAFAVDWQIGLEPVSLAPGVGGVAVDLRRPAPEPLELLAADWVDLLRPLRVTRTLDVLVAEQDAWIALAEPTDERAPAVITPGADAPDPAPFRRALLAHHETGDGVVLLLATPVDTRWTNLPTKPLFVPLLHETMRGVLGAPQRGLGPFVSGDRPALPGGYSGALRPLGGADTGDDDVQLQTIEAGAQPAAALDRPGVYLMVGDAGRPPIAVNPPAEAGDTRPAGERQLAQWLDGLGAWRFFEPAKPGASLRLAETGANIGWALLWIVLALLIIETLLARWVSHARRDDAPGLSRRLFGAVRAVPASSGDASAGRAA